FAYFYFWYFIMLSLLAKFSEADAKRIADLEYALSIHVGLHRSELDEITGNFNVGAFSIEQDFIHGDPDGEIFAIRHNEEDSHTALEEMRKVEEVAEHERLIGMFEDDKT
ncbi:hypothetical protein ACJX0J_020573, partial [Zea mays]